MSILRQDSVLKTRQSARPKENFKLEFERHGANVEDDNDFIHPPNARPTCVGLV